MLRQVNSSQDKSCLVNSSQAKSSQGKSSQIKVNNSHVNQIKSSQVKSYLASLKPWVVHSSLPQRNLSEVVPQWIRVNFVVRLPLCRGGGDIELKGPDNGRMLLHGGLEI